MVLSLNSIAAVSLNMGIGKNGNLPWPPLSSHLYTLGNVRLWSRLIFHSDERTFKSKLISKFKTNKVSGPNASDHARSLQAAEEERCLVSQSMAVLYDCSLVSVEVGGKSLPSKIVDEVCILNRKIPEGAHYLARSLDQALDLLESSELASKIDMIWIVGGSSVYKAAMDKPVHQRLFVTRILHYFESDTFFPEIDLEKYRLLSSFPGVPADIQEENGIQYKFEVYEKSI